MSSSNQRRPILYNGQTYAKTVTKGTPGRPKEMKFTYEEARDFVLSDIAKAKSSLKSMESSQRLPNEVVVGIIMQPEFTAKSYYPDSLFDAASEKFGLKEIGSRIYNDISPENDLRHFTKSSKMFFVRATEEGLTKFENQLNKNVFTLTKSFQEDVRKISSINILEGNEQILGFPSEWQTGKIEAVLHPFEIDRERAVKHFLDKITSAGAKRENVKYKTYSSGITFVSFDADKNVLEAVNGYNPLRTVHPLKMREFSGFFRSSTISAGPQLPVFKTKSPIVVGIFDGGVDMGNPYLQNYTESEISVSGTPIADYVAHGTQVTGTVLFGALNQYASGSRLPEPKVSVKHFGVLSTNSVDPDLYDAIDAIEKIVPRHKNIKVYNLSIGPQGPILDDSISRFTYSCDLLSRSNDVLFCIAVGNDGNSPGYDRIQSPSDSVNALSVGSYTTQKGKKIRASYSSIGPGREGCKMKPDVLAFGGCDQHPIHLIGSEAGKKVLNMGTSFATPIVAGMAGRLIGESNNVIDPLVAKALIIHATSINKVHTYENGHGFLPDNYNDIASCADKSYTLIYQGEIESGKYAEYLIPWDNTVLDGSVTFKWTVAVLTDVDELSSDDYTSSTVEVAFYPHQSKYMFSNVKKLPLDGVLKKSEIVDVIANPERADYLSANGWTQSTFPKTDSPKSQYKTESELRAQLKWDSLDTRSVNKTAKGISSPIFHVHTLGRGSRTEGKKVKFALVLTVVAPKAKIDIYSRILNVYNALIPIQLKSVVDIDVTLEPGL
jgi:hypothetical protein